MRNDSASQTIHHPNHLTSFMMGTFGIHPPSNFEMYSAQLYSPCCVSLRNKTKIKNHLCFLPNSDFCALWLSFCCSVLLSFSGNHHSDSASMSSVVLDYKWAHAVFVFLCLACLLYILPSVSICFVSSRISSFTKTL
jgi:hypothetical protein